MSHEMQLELGELINELFDGDVSPGSDVSCSCSSAGLPLGAPCWGAVLKGDGGLGCTAGFVSGKVHFKSKFCAKCVEAIDIPASRVRAMRPEMQGLFANSQRAGFWKTAPESLGGGEVRIANNTITCDGPWLIVYREQPPDLPWEPMPEGWVSADGIITLSVGKGTLVPSCEMWRHAPGRKPGGSLLAQRGPTVSHSWSAEKEPKRRRRAPQTGASASGSSTAGNSASAKVPTSLLPVVPMLHAQPSPVASTTDQDESPPSWPTTAHHHHPVPGSPSVRELDALAVSSADPSIFAAALIGAHSEVAALLEAALHPNAPLRRRLPSEQQAALSASLTFTRRAIREAEVLLTIDMAAEQRSSASDRAQPLPTNDLTASGDLQVRGVGARGGGSISSESGAAASSAASSPTPSVAGSGSANDPHSPDQTFCVVNQRVAQPSSASQSRGDPDLSVLRVRQHSTSVPSGLGFGLQLSPDAPVDEPEQPALPDGRRAISRRRSDSRLIDQTGRIKTLRESFKSMFIVGERRFSFGEKRFSFFARRPADQPGIQRMDTAP